MRAAGLRYSTGLASRESHAVATRQTSTSTRGHSPKRSRTRFVVSIGHLRMRVRATNGVPTVSVPNWILWLGEATMTTINPRQNGLLAALSAVELKRIRRQLELVDLPLGKILYEPGRHLEHVYFSVDCIISLLYV